MFGQGYVGTSEDVRRIRRQEKQREEQKKKVEALKQEKHANVDASGLRQFGASSAEVLEHAFKAETVGLVTRAEFVEKRNTLAERLEAEQAAKRAAAADAAAKDKDRRKAKKAKLDTAAKLSFLGDGEEEQEEQEGDQGAGGAAAATTNGVNGANGSASGGGARKYATLGKDPGAKADFLPDRDREEAEERMRQQLKEEWALRQQVVKNEPLQITYSYWDGAGHRRKITVRKGDSIGQFLAAVRDQLAPEFREMRTSSAGSLMYIKEDLILPHSVSFYDLIVNKARGKSGPLFHFDVHDDIRVQNDASIEKDESHAGKVVERHWYNRNKHIFPASRWEVFDPDNQHESYTTHGQEVN